MDIESQNVATFPMEDTRKLFYVQNHDWALKMTFRYLGEYQAAVATVHDAFLRLFQLKGEKVGRANRQGQPFDGKWAKTIFVRAAVNAALQGAEDTIPLRAGHVRTYLRELAICESRAADLSKYRNAIAQVLLLPLYPRLAYNLCVSESFSGDETAALLGINESEVADHVQTARTLLKNAMTGIDPDGLAGPSTRSNGAEAEDVEPGVTFAD
jgi:DNA-directed RNA polymerase specialized sigma24 family protein